MRAFYGLGDFCQTVSVGDVIPALVELGYMDASHQTYDDLDRAYRAWYHAAGLDPFAVGPFNQLIELVGVSQVKLCPGSSWDLLSAQAAGAAVAREAAAGRDVPQAPSPAPPPSAPAPRREAGFTPEASPWAWAFVAAVVGATWLYVRYDRRTTRR